MGGSASKSGEPKRQRFTGLYTGCEFQSGDAIMRKFALVLFLCLVASGRSSLFAQTPAPAKSEVSDRIPHFIVEGFDAYKKGGPDDAFHAWIKGSFLEGSKDALSQVNNLRQVQDYYGAYQSYALISTRDLTPKTRILYMEVDYDKGPLFGKFVVYHSDQGWALVSFDFNTKEQLILPSCP
jgi:hypothetical protein